MAAIDDKWAFLQISGPFLDNSVRVIRHQNMYVAQWYKYGKPVSRRAWSNNGVVDCSFPYSGKELTLQRDLQGKIQILTSFNGYIKIGHSYNWLSYKECSQTHLTLIRCGQSAPVLMETNDKKQTLLGNLDLSKGIACVSYNGKEEVNTDSRQIDELLCIFRNSRPSNVVLIMENQWLDIKCGDAFPPNGVAAADRPLLQDYGKSVLQFVALFYKHGEPLFGRAIPDGFGNVTAEYGWNGQAITDALGSFQMLVLPPMEKQGFEYRWLPYNETKDPNGEWKQVRVGNSAPCIVKNSAGHEHLGNFNLKLEKAGASVGSKEDLVIGPAVNSLLVLCRKP